MAASIVYNKSFKFAVRIVNLYKFLIEKKEYVLSKQILKSGTSIGANLSEANAAISKAEFSQKVSIAFKEAKETEYWLELLKETSYINVNSFDSINKDCQEICKMLFSILRTTRRVRNK